MNIRLFPALRSFSNFILPERIMKRPGSGGTYKSKYCYSVWLRHLYNLFFKGLINDLSDIQNIAEFGPGDSLGIGLSALYTGSKNYYALDVIKHTNIEKNLRINEELLNLFINRKEIPNGTGFENTYPRLDDYSFPDFLRKFDDIHYKNVHNNIKNVFNNRNSELKIKYVVPWYESDERKISNIDLIYSQAVMEHVDDIEFAYSEMNKWLRKRGIISHQIDFKTHEMTKEWNGHWFISEKVWKFLLRGRKYPINRLPLSSHLKIMEKSGFEIKNIIPVKKDNKFIKKNTKVKEINFTEEDLITSGALIQAVKL